MSEKANKMFDSDSNSEGEDLNFSTNAKFAKSYDKSSRKELFKKWKTQEVDSEESSSSSDESEDDVGFVDEEFDKTFFSTLASIKARDPKIYQKDVKFFGEVDLSNRKRSKDDKPITIRDLERKVLVEHGGMFEETEGKGTHLPVMTEEEKEDKKLFQQFYSDSDGEENEAESLFKAKKVEPVDDKPDKAINPEIIKPISVFWSDPNISKEEAYLRDYILKRRFTDDGGEGDDLGNLTEDEEDLDKQAEFEEKVNFRFEEQDHDFIKRFPRTIATSVRNVDDKRKQKRAEVKERKVREKEERKREIEKLKELKKKEIEEKISRLKQVAGSESIEFDNADLSDEFDPEAHDRKMQEIFNDEYYDVDEGEDKPECPDIEDLKVVDWDNYDPAEDEDVDPVDPHCDDPDFNMDCEYDPKAAKKNFEQEMIENSQSRKRRKRRSKFAEVLRKQKPVFNPEDEKTYAEYVDEYYKMDCEDIIGDVKCRFKYVETVPNDFGLSVEEILMAKNKELNKWASLKKAMQIRPKSIEMNEVQQYDRRRKNWFLKKNILKSVYGEESEDEEEAKRKTITVEKLTGSVKESKSEKEVQEESRKDSPKKKKPKKKAQKVETITKMPELSQGSDKQSPEKESKKQKKLRVKQNLPQIETNEELSKKKKKRKAEETQNEQRNSQNPLKKFKTAEKKVKSQVIDYETAQGKFAINENRLMAFGINPKKFRSKVKYGNSEKKANPQKSHKKKHQKQSQ